MPLVLAGDLAITGPGVSVRLCGSGDGPPTLVVSGPFRSGGRRARRLAAAIAAAGAALEVRDGRGRLLATAGPSLRSPLGRALLGTGRVRPTVHGVRAAVRGAAEPVPIDHEGDR
jgi:hypothetical protein